MRASLCFMLFTVPAPAIAQTFNLNDLSPQELNLIDRGLFFVGGSELHGKIQAQIDAQIRAMNAAAELQRQAAEAAIREQIKKELDTPK